MCYHFQFDQLIVIKILIHLLFFSIVIRALALHGNHLREPPRRAGLRRGQDHLGLLGLLRQARRGDLPPHKRPDHRMQRRQT